MKKIALLLGLLWASPALAQVCPAGSTCQPFETYTYGSTAATAPYASSLRVPVAPSGTASSLQYFPLNVMTTLTDTQTLTNKTLTSPALNTPTITGATLSGTMAGAPVFSGNVTFSGRPVFSGTLTGTQVSCLGLDASNNLTIAGAACGSGGGGGVSSVGLSVPATSIFGVTGSPITTSGTIGLTTSGTSGGIPYFSSTTQLATSAALAANALVIGGGAGVAPATTTTGSGILTFIGTPTSANLAAAVTDETGSGALVFGTAPTIAGGALSGTFTGTPTLSGNLIFSGRPVFSGTLTGTQTKCLGLDVSNNLTISGSACGSGGGGGVSTVTDGTHTQTSATTISLSSGLVTTNGSSGTAPITLAPPVRTAASPSIATTDLAGQVNISSGGFTIPGSVFTAASQSVLIANYAGSTSALTNTSGLTLNSGGGCVSGTGIPAGAAWAVIYNGTSLDCQQVISATTGAAVHTATIGWTAGVNPNNALIQILPANSTLTSIIGNVETATGGTATVSVNVAASGTACSAGTTVHSGSLNANGTAATNQTLTLTTTAVTSPARLCLQTTGTTTWTGGTGIGGITVTYTTP